jgi:hypothetical protein
MSIDAIIVSCILIFVLVFVLLVVVRLARNEFGKSAKPKFGIDEQFKAHNKYRWGHPTQGEDPLSKSLKKFGVPIKLLGDMHTTNSSTVECKYGRALLINQCAGTGNINQRKSGKSMSRDIEKNLRSLDKMIGGNDD